MKPELGDKVALVTGAGLRQEIGRATALRLVDAGADVADTDLQVTAELEELVLEIRSRGRRAGAFLLNIKSSDDIRRCVQEVVKELGGIDILVNNAGTTVGARPFLEVSETDFDESYFVNLRGAALLSQVCIPIMQKRGGGSIINNASTAGLGAEAGFGAYTAKHALIGLTKTIAAEFGPHNIRCNAVCPGYTATDMHKDVNERLAVEASVTVDEMACALRKRRPSTCSGTVRDCRRGGFPRGCTVSIHHWHISTPSRR